MYHPGKILAVHSTKDKNIKGDNSVQATLEMWDENVITFLVSPLIANKIKKGDIVLVDYRPVSDKYPFPNHVAIKILKDIKGREIWNIYTDYFKKRKQVPKEKIKAVKQQPMHTYAG